jgi:cell division protein FtsB
MPKRKYSISKGRSGSAITNRNRIIAALLLSVGIYFLISSIFGEMGFIKYYRMRQQCISIDREIADLRKDNARLIHQVQSLKNDSAYIERIARDKLGLARSGEIVYYYDGF